MIKLTQVGLHEDSRLIAINREYIISLVGVENDDAPCIPELAKTAITCDSCGIIYVTEEIEYVLNSIRGCNHA